MIGMLSALLVEHNVDVSRKFYQYNVVEPVAAAPFGQYRTQYSTVPFIRIFWTSGRITQKYMHFISPG